MYIGSLTGSPAPNRNRWDADVSITVIDQNESPVQGASVQGSWDIGDASSCVTGVNGSCVVNKNRIKTSVASATFAVQNVSRSGYLYDLERNDVDSVKVAQP